MEWVGNGMAIGVHCDARNISTKGGRGYPIGICGAPRGNANGGNKVNGITGGAPIAWSSGGGVYSGIQDAIRAFDTARFL